METLTRFVLGGGKRLRPAFCHWAYVGAGGGADDPAVIDTGAAFELLHAFALVHDDVMDGSATRRGERTVHIAFDATHAGGDVAGRVPPLRRGRRHPHRRPRRGVRRPAHDRGPGRCLLGLERAEDRAERGPVPRRAGYGARWHRPRHRPAHRPVQVGEVHDRAAAPRRRGAGRSARRAGRAAHRLRRTARRGVPAPRRHPRHLRRRGPHRQAGRRRPPGGQAHPAAGDRPGAGRPAPTARCSTGSAAPTSARTRSRPSRPSSPPAAPAPRSRRPSAGSPPRRSPPSRPHRSGPRRSTPCGDLATYVASRDT